MKKYIKIKKINKIFNCGIKKSYLLLKKYKNINNIKNNYIKKNKKNINHNKSKNFIIYYKINNKKNYLIINKFYFESDLFKENKNIKKKIKDINKLIFKNLYFNIKNKKKIEDKINFVNLAINENFSFKTKIIKSKDIFCIYLHLNKKICVLETKKKINKTIVLNVFYYNTKNIKKVSKKNNIFDTNYRIETIKNFKYLKKIYLY
ncbi:hypothetical protein C9I84_111 [Candidatus Vidania fulgoroideae]|uniref:Uncharacterized protein n=1 Tax=Candidatus Vidania fulgoroideorum TaxID=881286 RepID=A0A346E0J4_9PROT|nr:hypothetical protein C9I84_111 [Candidatus Vidania fulgoroideae]